MTYFYVSPGSSIQDAIDGGADEIELGAGTYDTIAPIVVTPGLSIHGVGPKTIIQPAMPMSAVIAVGNGQPVDGVSISRLVLDCNDKASIGLDVNIVGSSGFYQGEPDSICRFSDLRVYDAVDDGVALRGTDTQACILAKIRVRRAGRYGFRVEAPDNWLYMCEATTREQIGNSAGFYVGTAIPGSNGSGGSNNCFMGCKAWYCRDYGWHVKGTRNRFDSCESQDTRSHGWFVEWDKNVFTGCVADTAGMYDVGGVSGMADGFYVAAGSQTSMVGCQSFDRKPNGRSAQQRYGFNVPTSMVSSGRLNGYSGWDNASALLNQR